NHPTGSSTPTAPVKPNLECPVCCGWASFRLQLHVEGAHVRSTGYSRFATRATASIEDLRSGNSGAEPRAQAEIGRAEGRVHCRYDVGVPHPTFPRQSLQECRKQFPFDSLHGYKRAASRPPFWYHARPF